MQGGTLKADPEPSQPSPPAKTRWLALGGLLGLCILIIALFRPALDAPLFADDSISVKRAATMDHWTDALYSDAFSYFRPVKTVFFYSMENAGATAVGYHVVTLIAYLVATIGVFFLARNLFSNSLCGLAVAAIWSLSATNVTIGAWPSCFNISIAVAAMTFGLLAWDHWRGEHGKAVLGVAAFLCFALALCSYETAISLAPLAVLIDLFRGRRVLAKGSLARYAGIAALVVCYALIRHSQGASLTKDANPSFTSDIESWQIAASAPYFLWTHFLMWAAPWGRLECLGSYLWDRSIPAIILPFCWVFLIGIASLCVRMWKPGSIAIFGLAWFFAASFPSNNFIPFGNTPYADYYIPIPAIGLSLTLVAVFRILLKVTRETSIHSPGFVRAAWTGMILIIAVRITNLTAFQNWVQAWTNPAMVLAHTAAARPHQYLAKSILASIMLDAGDARLAEDYALRALEDTDEFAMPFRTLGQIRYDQGKFEEAAGLFQTALSKRHLTDSSTAISFYYLGKIIGRDPSRADEAFACFIKVLERHNMDIHYETVIEVADLYDRADRQADRIKTLRRGLEIYPADPRLTALLQQAQEALGEKKDAS